jgi:hypothetical protein
MKQRKYVFASRHVCASVILKGCKLDLVPRNVSMWIVTVFRSCVLCAYVYVTNGVLQFQPM